MTRKLKRRRAYMTAIPLVLVNFVAFAGQLGYIRAHVHWITPGQVAFALALESVALFLGYMSHQALMAEDSAYGLRLASYVFGLLIGAMNYSHYSGPGLRPTFEAVATGLMSVASPWLWGIYSRRQSRDVLKAKGLIVPRAVKLGALRWLLWAGPTWRVFRRAVWLGVNDPYEALVLYRELDSPDDVGIGPEEPVAEPELPNEPPSAIEVAETKAEAVRAALAELGDSVTAAVVADWLAARGWEVTPSHVRVIRSKVRKNASYELEPVTTDMDFTCDPGPLCLGLG